MKKILLLSLLFNPLLIYAQKVIATNIQAKQIDEANISITYELPKTTKSQTFTVTILAAINGAPKMKLQGVSGAVGNEVAGGQSSYTIKWNVFKDVEKLENVEFYIDVSDQVEPVNNGKVNQEKRWFVGANFINIINSGRYSYHLGFGLSGGYLKNWGLMGMANFSEAQEINYGTHQYFTFSVSPIKLISDKPSLSTSVYAGLGLSISSFTFNQGGGGTDPSGIDIVFDAGAIIRFKKFLVRPGIRRNDGQWLLNFGLGYLLTRK